MNLKYSRFVLVALALGPLAGCANANDDRTCGAASVKHADCRGGDISVASTRKIHQSWPSQTYPQFEFKERSEEMFEALCNTIPWLFRRVGRSSLVKALTREGCGQVTQEIMYVVCKQVTPARFLDNAIQILDEIKTRN